MSQQALIPSHFATPIGSLDAYIAMVHRVPMLTLEEEQRYSHDFQKNENS